MYQIKPNWRLLQRKPVALPAFNCAVADGGRLIMARKKSRSKAKIRRVPMREFSRSLPMSLLRAREAAMRLFRPSLRNHGLTEQQWRTLRALSSHDALGVTEIARGAFCLCPRLSRVQRDP